VIPSARWYLDGAFLAIPGERDGERAKGRRGEGAQANRARPRARARRETPGGLRRSHVGLVGSVTRSVVGYTPYQTFEHEHEDEHETTLPESVDLPGVVQASDQSGFCPTEHSPARTYFLRSVAAILPLRFTA
jgi:hypothetical protein